MVNNISGMLNSKLRFTGMASGLDTDSIIQQMMRVERMKVDKVNTDKELTELRAFRTSATKTVADKDAVIVKLQGIIADNVLAGEPAKQDKKTDNWNDNLKDYVVPKEYKANAYGR